MTANRVALLVGEELRKFPQVRRKKREVVTESIRKPGVDLLSVQLLPLDRQSIMCRTTAK
jgi:hypothetical protein